MILQPGPPSPAEFIPIFGMVSGIVAMIVVGWAIVRVAQGQLGQAIARRIQGKGADPELRDHLDELRDQVAMLEHRLAETEERLDFTERLLSGPQAPKG